MRGELSQGMATTCSTFPARPTIKRAARQETAIKGPRLKTDLDVRRVWRCPACGYERRALGDQTALRCRCGDKPFMKLVSEHRFHRRPNQPINVYVDCDELAPPEPAEAAAAAPGDLTAPPAIVVSDPDVVAVSVAEILEVTLVAAPGSVSPTHSPTPPESTVNPDPVTPAPSAPPPLPGSEPDAVGPPPPPPGAPRRDRRGKHRGKRRR